ncbi:MAG: HAD family phosphatase [Lachnospiraceae bacterium]|nr:HAD family phosphatase [Lachnospiraceae bacterium]
MIRNIIFDMGQVLIYFRPESFMSRYFLSEEEKKLLEREVFHSREWPLLDWGVLTEEQALERICPRLPQALHPVARRLVEMWDRPIEPVEGMAELIKELKEVGYGIYLLSNASLRHPDYWKRVPGSEYFDGLVVSAFEKKIKPNPDIYECLLERFGLAAEECFFIDDQPVNVAGAFVSGMDGVVFRGATDLRIELQKRGVCLREGSGE